MYRENWTIVYVKNINRVCFRCAICEEWILNSRESPVVSTYFHIWYNIFDQPDLEKKLRVLLVRCQFLMYIPSCHVRILCIMMIMITITSSLPPCRIVLPRCVGFPLHFWRKHRTRVRLEDIYRDQEEGLGRALLTRRQRSARARERTAHNFTRRTSPRGLIFCCCALCAAAPFRLRLYRMRRTTVQGSRSSVLVVGS